MFQDISARPYFIRAAYQWCIDKGYSPHILVNWSESNASNVPPSLVNKGKIVFNISPEAVRHFVIDNDTVFFTARFLGKTTEVRFPISDVISVYAREQQSGITFPPLPEQQPPQPQKPSPSPSAPARRSETDIKII